MDPRTWAALRATLDGIVARIAEAPGATPAGLEGLGRNADLTTLVALAQARRSVQGAASAARAYDVADELGPVAAPVAAKKAEVMIDEVSPDVFAALQHPKLVALHARFLAPGEDARLIEVGERAIALACRRVREKTRADEQHLVSLLEASLLLRHAFAKRVRVDPDVITRVKHAAAYL